MQIQANADDIDIIVRNEIILKRSFFALERTAGNAKRMENEGKLICRNRSDFFEIEQLDSKM